MSGGGVKSVLCASEDFPTRDGSPSKTVSGIEVRTGAHDLSRHKFALEGASMNFRVDLENGYFFSAGYRRDR